MSISWNSIKHWMKLRVDCQHNNIDNKKENVLDVHGHASQYPTLKILIQNLGPNTRLLFFFWFVGWCCCLVPRLYVCLNTFAFIVLLYLYPPSTEKAEKDVKIILHSPSLVYVCFRLEIPFFSFFLLFLLSTSHFHHPPLRDRRANQAPSHQTIIKLTEGSFGDISGVEAENCVGFRRFDELHWDGDRICRPKSITLMNFKSFSAQMLTTNNNKCWSFFLIFYLLVSIYIFFSLPLLVHINFLLLHNWLVATTSSKLRSFTN